MRQNEVGKMDHYFVMPHTPFMLNIIFSLNFRWLEEGDELPTGQLAPCPTQLRLLSLVVRGYIKGSKKLGFLKQHLGFV